MRNESTPTQDLPPNASESSRLRLLFTRREAAEILGVSDRTVAVWEKQRKLRSRRLGPQIVRYSLDELRRFANGDDAS